MSDPNAGAIAILRKTQPWVRLVSIFGFLCVGLIALLAAASWVSISTERIEHVPLAALLIYPVLFVLYLVPSWQLWKYSQRIGTFVAQGHTVQLEAALDAQRGFWRFAGIVIVASAVATALALIVAMMVGITAGL